jgi:hypothetical protein
MPRTDANRRETVPRRAPVTVPEKVPRPAPARPAPAPARPAPTRPVPSEPAK